VVVVARERRPCFVIPRGPYPPCPKCDAELLPSVDEQGLFWYCPVCGEVFKPKAGRTE